LLAGPGAVMRTADRLHTLAHLESRGVPVPVFRTPGDLVSTAEALHLFGGAFLAVPRCPDGETTPLLVTSEEDLAWSSLDDTWVLQEVLLGEEYLALTHRPAKGNRDRRVGVVHERSRSVDPAFAPERGRGASAPPAMAVHAPDIEKLALAAVRALGLIGQAEVTIRLTRRGSPRVIDVSAAFGAHIRHTPEVLEALVGFAPEERVTSHLRSMRHIRGAG
ncbi:MAG: hypothetical protein Q4G40_10490, partial [Brachybacterium sp.]|nr:hypothetical protein [Brachybacterium sp.]